MYDVLIRPVVSEKSYTLADEGKYRFVVNPEANKSEVKIAVEKIFNVKVAKVNVLNKKGKSYKNRFGSGKRKDSKHAIVTLAPGNVIDVFGAQIAEGEK
jgi:large subunit ribosomal protein L23